MFTQPAWVNSLNHALSLLTVIGTVVLVTWFILLIIQKRNSLFTFISKHALIFGFILSLTGTFMSLFYSEYVGYLPCALCWIQRIFLYPQVVIFGVALWKKDKGAQVYAVALSCIGAIVALYHSYIQLGYDELLPCPATGAFADCAKPNFIEFGFVTFPAMSLVLFFTLILLYFTSKKGER